MPENRLTRWFRKSKVEPEADPAPVHTPPSKPIRPEDYVGDDPEKNESYVRDRFVSKARSFLTKLPMAEDVASAYFCMLDPATPRWVKGVTAAALAYFILPFDAILDAIPLAGLMDDITVLTATLTAISAFITPEHRAKARRWMADEKLSSVPK